MCVSYLLVSLLYYHLASEARNVIIYRLLTCEPVVDIEHTSISLSAPAYSAHCREWRSHGYLLVRY